MKHTSHALKTQWYVLIQINVYISVALSFFLKNNSESEPILITIQLKFYALYCKQYIFDAVSMQRGQ